MAIRFDKRYVDVARQECYKVYVDRITPNKIVASEKAYIGDRIRIYPRKQFYGGAVIFKSNLAFQIWLRKYLDTVYEGVEDGVFFVKPKLA